MFSLFGKKSPTGTAGAVDDKDEHDLPLKQNASPSSSFTVDTSAVAVENSYQLTVEVHGAHGTPANISCMKYLRNLGLICLGTHDGAVYVIGDGAEYVLPNANLDGDEIGVNFLVPRSSDELLVVYTDGSLCLASLPTLAVVHYEKGGWLHAKSGAITCVYSDELSDRPFVYFGTSCGMLFVVHILDAGSVRVCDYVLRYQDFGLSEEMTLTSLHLSPKDERYLAVGFGVTDSERGAVVMFDFIKKKPLKVFNTGPVSSLTWNQGGEIIYAGTLTGQLMACTEKGGAVCVYHSSSEAGGVSDEEEDDEDDDNGNGHGATGPRIPISQLRYLPSQPLTEDPCLFLLLGSAGSELDYLKNVIVGLTPAGGVGADLSLAFSLPPLAGEDVCSFELVATTDPKSTADKAVPGILLLTKQGSPEDRDSIEINRLNNFALKMVRCPASAMTAWPLEIGMLPEPAAVPDGQVGPAILTALASYPPPSSHISIASVLIKGLEDPENALSANGCCVTPREFYEHRNLLGSTSRSSLHDVKWDLLLGTGNTEDINTCIQRAQNVVLMGHSDGNVIAWANTRSEVIDGHGRGASMIPIAHFDLTQEGAISAFGIDDTSGILAVGTQAGGLRVYETYDTDNLKGFVQYQKTIIEGIPLPGSVGMLREGDEDSNGEGMEEVENKFAPTIVRVVKSVKLPSKVTVILPVGEICALFIGTEDGGVYWWPLLYTSTKGYGEPIQVNTSGLGLSGSRAVSGLHFSSFVKGDEVVPAIYATFTNGHVIVFSPFSGEVISYTVGAGLIDTIGLDEMDISSNGAARGATYVTTNKAAVVCTLDARNKLSSFISSGKLLRLSKYELEMVTRSQAMDVSPTKSIFGMLSSNKPAVESPAKLIQRPQIKVPASDEQEGLPTTLLVVAGRSLLTYDLSKFTTPSGPKSKAIPPSAMVSNQYLTKSKLIAGQVMSIFEEATRAWSEAVPCIVCISSDGVLLVLRIRDRTLICGEHLLSGVVEAPAQLTLGSILSNQECFVIRQGSVGYPCTFAIQGHMVNAMATPRIAPVFNPIEVNSPKLIVVASRARTDSTGKAPKRPSLLNMASSVLTTDLSKLFTKTLEQRQKDELFGTSRATDSTDGEGPTTQRQLQGVADVASTMADTRDALLERGERINRLAMKGDDLQQGALEFSQNTKAMVKDLKKKKKWGFF